MSSQTSYFIQPIHWLALLIASTICGMQANAQNTETFVPPAYAPKSRGADASSKSEALISEKDNVALMKDSTVGEALQRRPDLTYANVKIDGEETRLSVSEIPTEAVEKIEILKAVTPDLDANSRGGSVSLRSKPAFELEQQLIKSSFDIRYRALFDQANPQGSFTFGSAFGENRRMGARITVNYEESVRGSDALIMDWQRIEFEGQSFTVLEDHEINTWKGQETEVGLSGTLDYKISDRFFIYFRGNWEDEESVINQPRMQFRFNAGEYAGLSNTEVDVSSGEVKRELTGFEGLSDEFELATGGFYDGEELSFDYRISHRESDYIQPDFFVLEFVQEDVDIAYQLDATRFPRAYAASHENILDPSLFLFEDLNSQEWRSHRSDSVASFNLKRSHRLGLRKGFFKAGFKFRERTRSQIGDDHIYDQFDGSFTLADVLSEFSRASHLEGRFSLNTVPDLAKARQFLSTHRDRFVLNQRRTRERADSATYDAGESILAFYGMGTFHRENLTLLAGVRVERTETDFTANEVLIDDSGEYQRTNPVSGSSGYTRTFPGIHLKIDRGDRLTLIGSWTETIERPRFSSLTPFRRVDLEDEELKEGNPNLRPTLYSNLDFSIDYNLSDEDLVSLEFFYKKVDDVIFSRTSTVPTGTYAGFERTRDENSASGSLWGIELTWDQSLDFLPVLPDGFNLNTNYTYNNTEIEYPNRPGQTLPIASHPDRKLQLSLTYDQGKLYAQLRVKHESTTIQRVSEVPEEDRFKEGLTEVTLSTSYQLTDRLRLVGRLRRLTDTPSSIRYEGTRDQLVNYRYGGQSARFGFKYEW